jgi:PTS system nitrogen regulatory IIA component
MHYNQENCNLFHNWSGIMVEMLTAKDMQTILQVDRSTIYRMAEAGRLPAIKVGKQWRFPSDRVDEWLGTKTPAPVHIANAQPQNHTINSQSDISELLPLECVQLILDTFADSLDVMLVVTDMEGNPITEVSHPCGLFAAISQTPNAIQKCVEDWRSMAAAIDLQPKYTSSHLGLLCARGMIRVGTELKGMVFVGGIAPEKWPPSPEQLQKMAAEFSVQPKDLEAHLDEVYYLGNEEQVRVLSFVQRIANIVAHIASERSVFMNKLDAIAQLIR